MLILNITLCLTGANNWYQKHFLVNALFRLFNKDFVKISTIDLFYIRSSSEDISIVVIFPGRSCIMNLYTLFM